MGEESLNHRMITGSVPALELVLADAVSAHKARDPLAPLTILVGETVLRPYLRRRLADLAGGHLNLRIVTAGDFGLMLGEHALQAQGREPLPFLGDRVLAQQSARKATGYFSPVADMPGFGSAVHRTLRDLRSAGLGPDDLEAASKGDGSNADKLGDLAVIHRDYEAGRARFYAPDDGLAHADPAALLGDQLLVYGLWTAPMLLRNALASVASRVPVTILLPVTGTEADAVHEPLREWLAEAFGVESSSAAEPVVEDSSASHLRRHLFARSIAALPDATARLVSAPDPGREAQEAVRACLRWAEEGIAFHEMAVLYRNGDRYRSLLEAAFAEAEMPFYLHEGTPLSERPLGRRVMALLDLVEGNLERGAVMQFLSDARLPNDTWEAYDRPSVAAWDSISRDAGVLEGLEQWQSRLKTFGEALTERYAEDPPKWLDGRLATIDALARFVTDLHSRFEERPGSAHWTTHVEFFLELLRLYVADGDPIAQALAGLARLDPLADLVAFDRFCDVVRAFVEGLRAADVLGSQQGAFGLRGVQILDVNTSRHLVYRAAVVVGLAERAFPPPPRQDALLLDEERSTLNARGSWQIPLRALGPDPEPLQFALAVATGTERVQLSFARADAGSRGPLLPSSFFRAAAEALTGTTVRVEDVDSLPPEVFERISASRLGAFQPDEALTEVEYVRTLLEREPPLGRQVLAARKPGLDASTAAEAARWRPEFSVFDGVLGDEGRRALSEHWTQTRPFSPSRFETYSQCPYQFFLGAVLRLQAIEEPEAIDRISALEKGNVVHRILERFMREHAGVPPSEGRRNAQVPRLLDVARQELDAAESGGVTGYPLLWRMDREVILDDLRTWYDREALDPDTAAMVEGEYEVRFGPAHRGEQTSGGLSDDQPLTLVAGGREIRFSGRIDRLNWSPDRSRFRVIDYKSGSARVKSGRLDGGKALQLPIYVHAAARALGVEASRGSAQYFYVSRKGGFERAVFDSDDLRDRYEDFERVLTEVSASIADGDFHAEPGDACKWCSFKTICDARREPIRRAKGNDERALRFDARKEIR